jgi:hypothetical protein
LVPKLPSKASKNLGAPQFMEKLEAIAGVIKSCKNAAELAGSSSPTAIQSLHGGLFALNYQDMRDPHEVS